MEVSKWKEEFKTLLSTKETTTGSEWKEKKNLTSGKSVLQKKLRGPSHRRGPRVEKL